MLVNYNKIFIFCVCLYISVISARNLNIISINENWICNTKKSCLDCLRLAQCSWCSSENKCFSGASLEYQDYCETEKRHNNYGMSLEENARCGCDDEIRNNTTSCEHPVHGSMCSNRGTCQCGRCVCNDVDPVSDNASKTILGEYCEYDNFSCNHTKCNEGPYNIYELQAFLENGE